MSSPNITRMFGLPLLAVVAILRSLKLLRSLSCFEARFRLRTRVSSMGREWREANAPARNANAVGVLGQAMLRRRVRFKVMRSTLSIRRIDGGSADDDDE